MRVLPLFALSLVCMGGICAGEPDDSTQPPAPQKQAEPLRVLQRTVDEWVAYLQKYENPDERKLAMFCLAEFGPAAADAVPELLAVSKDETQPENERFAAQTLGAIGPAAKAAVPHLLALLGDEAKPVSHRAAACGALALIDPSNPRVRKAVISAVQDRAADLRAEAIDAIVPWAAADSNAFNALTRALQNDASARAAATALMCTGASGQSVLIKSLDRGGAQTKIAIAEALGFMGREGAEAVPALLKTLKRERDSQAQAALVLAAARIAPRDPAVLDALVERLGLLNAAAGSGEDSDQERKEIAAVETRVLAAAGVSALGTLRKALHAREENVRLRIIAVLARMTASGEAADLLVEAARDEKPAVRLAAVKALDAFGPAAAKAQAALEQLARGETRDPGLKAAAELAAVNVARAPGSPRHRSPFEIKSAQELQELLRNPAPAVRQEAAEALRVQPDETGVVARALIEALDDADEHVKIAAGRSLLRFGKFSRPALPKLSEWLDSASTGLRKAALVALAGMGADAKPVLPSIVAMAASPLLDDDKEMRKFVSIVLRVIGPDAVPLLENELKSADPAVRARIARALGSMELVAAAAIPSLIELSESAVDSDAQAGFAALQATGPAAYSLCGDHLARTIRSSDFPDRRKWAAYAAGEIKVPEESDKAGVIDALAMALLDEDESVCRAAHGALVRIGAPALPKMRNMMQLGEGEAPYWAVRVMARMKADPQDVIPRLIELTQPGKRPAERGTAAELLEEYAPAHTEMIPVLLRVINDREDCVARAAMRSLAAFGEQVLGPLRQLLREPNAQLRRRALQALGVVRERLEK